MILFADYVFGDQSLSFVDERLRIRDKDLLCTIDLPISGEAVSRLGSCFTSAEHLNVPPKRLLELFISHPSTRVDKSALDLEEKRFPSDPARLVRVTANGYEIRTLQPQAFVILGSALRRTWFHSPRATDSGLADAVFQVYREETRLEILSNPEVFICAVFELHEDKRAQNGHFGSQIYSHDPRMELIRHIQRCGLTTQARMLAFLDPLLVHNKQLPVVSADDVLEKLLDDVPVNDYPARQHAFMNEIGGAILAEEL